MNFILSLSLIIWMSSRSKIVFFINNKRQEVSDRQCFQTLAEFLRYEVGLPGTKVVCAEGDCGACTALLGSFHDAEGGKLKYKSVNTCILPLFSMDACHLITVEGLRKGQELHPVQKAMVDNFGAQCGYCTPGFICSMAAMVENAVLKRKTKISEKTARNYLTGNLCRCTGYQPILKAAESLDLKTMETLRDRYHNDDRISEMKSLASQPVHIKGSNFELHLPVTIEEAVKIKGQNQKTKIIAGSTDSGVLVNKGKEDYISVLSLMHISSLYEIKKESGYLQIGARVTLSSLLNVVETEIPELGKMLNVFASPQIKNQATLIGNMMNASPIADTIPFLMANDAEKELQSINGKRWVPIADIFQGYKNLKVNADEIATSIRIRIPSKNTFVRLFKVARRKDLDISAITFAAEVEVNGNKIEKARVALGGVGPTPLRMKEIEKKLNGAEIEKSVFENVSADLLNLIKPLSDVRGSDDYRLQLCQNLFLKFYNELSQGQTP
ncbi:MAG: xanthine dehydrogenase small subunit [Pseudobdellovibrionaceae bacterium]